MEAVCGPFGNIGKEEVYERLRIAVLNHEEGIVRPVSEYDPKRMLFNSGVRR